MKRFLVILIILTIPLSLAACGKDKVATKKGEAIKYTLDEIYENNKFGFYVKNTDQSKAMKNHQPITIQPEVCGGPMWIIRNRK